MKISTLQKKYLSANKIPQWAVFLLIVASILFVIFYSRQIFFFKYEPEYYENLYYHSQWNIPGSPRGISDGMLYKFVGYRLALGENTFYLNYEVPPFGKYLYGLAELFIGNPYWVSLVLYLSSIAVFYLLAKEIFGNKKLASLITLVFTTTPFVATQVRDTMLDLPLMFFYLLNVFFFVKYLRKPKILSLALAGIALGIATGTKIGIYTPAVILLGLPLIFWAKKNFLLPVLYLISIGIGYGIAYISYFLKHPNPIPFIRLHKKQLEFYYNPDSTIDYLNQWRGIFINSYEGWWGAGKTSLGDWSWVLPLGTIAALIVLILAIYRKETIWIYISGLAIIFLVINTLIPFWPRYLMPIIPAFILLIAYFLRKYAAVLLLLAVFNLPFLYSSMAVKDYVSNAHAPANFISHRAYRELYRSIDPNQRNSIQETEFINNLENFYETLKVRRIEATPKEVIETEKGANVNFDIKYTTDFGELSFSIPLEFIDVNHQAVMNWKWDYLWPGFTAGDKITVEEKGLPVKELRRYGEVVAIPAKGEKLYIITRHIDWPKTLDDLDDVVNTQGVNIGDRLRETVPDDYPRFVGILNGKLSFEERRKVSEIKGVKLYEFDYLGPAPGVRKETALDAASELLKSNPELFYVSADIYFEKNGKRVYIQKPDPSKPGIIHDL